MEFQDLISYKALHEQDSVLFSQVETVYNLVKHTINSISGCFKNFTMHDIGHSIRVAHYMEQLAFGIDENQEKRLKEFNSAELAILLLSALLHDIGMFIRPIDKEEIINGKIKHADKLKITYKGVLEVKKENEEEAIKEIIRLTHAARVFDFLNHDFKDGMPQISQILKIDNNYEYANDIGLICQAHGEDYSFIKTQLRSSITKGNYEYNLQYFAVLLRIADYLDLDKQRTPMLWFSMMDIEGFSKSEWETHFQISNEIKLKQYDETKMQIYFDGTSSNAKIHRKYLKYIDNLRAEIENADTFLNSKNAKQKYKLNVTTRIDDLVQTIGFEYSDLRLNLDYAAITELLMGKNIYGDNKLGLRELIQNAIDACKLIREIDKGKDERPEPKITIYVSKQNQYVKIRDTGIGMTLDVIKNHFLNIGKSYYKSNEYLFNNYNYKPIGQYGIGFLACFLLSDNVSVTTKYYDSNDVYRIELEKNSEYVVTNTEHLPMVTGTEIKLDYKGVFSAFKTIDELKLFIETYFYTDIPIFIKDDDANEQKQIFNKLEIDNNAFFSQDKKQSLVKIDIPKYSTIAKGFLYLVPSVKKQNFCYDDITLQSIYLYDKTEKVFKKTSSLKNSFYIQIPYVKVSTDQYELISKDKRNVEGKAKALLALGKKTNNFFYLYIGLNDDFPFLHHILDNDIASDDLLNSILTNSKLPIYEELFLPYKMKKIYIYNNQSFSVYPCGILSNNYYPQLFFEKFKDRPSELYYKDILIKDFRAIYAQIPFKYHVFGVFNYLNNDLKLDVSRNEVIGGYNKLLQEFNRIIFKYFIEKEDAGIKKDVLMSMLKYFENQI